MKIFEPADVGAVTVVNRFVRSATTEGLASGQGCSTSMLTKLMVQLVRGGVGLIITGQTAISPEGRAGIRQLCLWHTDHLPALLEMTGKVHDAGGKIIIQISHAGIYANTSLTGDAAIAPTMRPQGDGSICRAMTRHDIQRIIDAFAGAASLARSAGFDGIQVCAAHGHLLSSFLSPYYNRRRDEYGGTAENRARFLLEVLQAVRGTTSRDFPLLVKMNVNDFVPGGLTVNDTLKTAAMLEIAGVRAIELSGGTPQSGGLSPARAGKLKPESEGYYKEDARYFRSKIGIPVILGGGFRSLHVAEKFLQEGICDFIAMSRPLVCEPDLVQQWKEGRQEPSACVSDNQCCLLVRAGKGLYCLPRTLETKKALSQDSV